MKDREATGRCARCNEPINSHSLEEARICTAVLIDRDAQLRHATGEWWAKPSPLVKK